MLFSPWEKSWSLEAFGAQLFELEPSSRLDWKGSSSHLKIERDFHHSRELGGLWTSPFARTKGSRSSWWVWPHQNESLPSQKRLGIAARVSLRASERGESC
uniref:Uncharacterized protein n=1 Tax=Ananas comosus var. bracteatus TaxID=296719 RepID=A0A6V7NK15_ANACO|nr:unnamed protein product [Ananas comosus var. bracteatus]